GRRVAADMTPEIDETFVVRQIKGRAYRVPQGADHRFRVAFEPDHVGDVAVPARIRQPVQQRVQIAQGRGALMRGDIPAEDGADVFAQPVRVKVPAGRGKLKEADITLLQRELVTPHL